jgi:tRNA (Thr-GGU) A37 N-methylase
MTNLRLQNVQSKSQPVTLHPIGYVERDEGDAGVFATRSPRRPNPIGMTTVRVRRVEGHVMEVVGLDARDGSPVLDIKVHASNFAAPYSG